MVTDTVKHSMFNLILRRKDRLCLCNALHYFSFSSLCIGENHGTVFEYLLLNLCMQCTFFQNIMLPNVVYRAQHKAPIIVCYVAMSIRFVLQDTIIAFL